MGTGASAQVTEAVQGASVEEVQALLDQLSPEDKAKLQDALADAQAPAKEAAAPAEAAPAEGAAGAASADATTAPYLAEYFSKVRQRTDALIGDQEKLFALALDPEAKKKFAEESKAWFESEAKPLLEKSFKHHDTRANDVLDKDEAAVFFKHMIHEETQFAKAMSALSIEAGVKMSMGVLESLSEEEREKIKPLLAEQMKKDIEAAQAEVQKKEDNYKASKDELNAAAFKVLDTNADGTIQLAEFIAALEPDTGKNLELKIALGYTTQEEVEAAKKREEQAKEEAGGCSQQ